MSPSRVFHRVAGIILFLLILGGCAASNSLYREDATHDDGRILIDNVPFIKQEPNYCGPASLAIIFNFWGMGTNQDEIARAIYSRKLKGTLSIKLISYAIRNGFEAEMYRGNFQDMKEKIVLGFPLIVSHKSQKRRKRVHYLIVWGFDDNEKMIYVHSGTKKNLTMDYETFLKRWNFANKLTFLIYPGGKGKRRSQSNFGGVQ